MISVYFSSVETICRSVPLVTRRLNIPRASMSCRRSLLSDCFVGSPRGDGPPLLVTFCLFMLLLMSISLVLVVRGSFTMSVGTHMRRFNVFSDVKTAPKRVHAYLLRRTTVLYIVPVLLKDFIKVTLAFKTVRTIGVLTSNVINERRTTFACRPLIFTIAVLASFLAILVST